METVFTTFFAWIQDPTVISGVGQAVLGRATYDTLKSLGESFTKKLGIFFSNQQEVDTYFQAICTRSASNKTKPYRDIEDIYEEISSKHKSDKELQDFLSEVKEWFKENNSTITILLNSSTLNNPTQNISQQKAGRDINIVQGKQINYNR